MYCVAKGVMKQTDVEKEIEDVGKEKDKIAITMCNLVMQSGATMVQVP